MATIEKQVGKNGTTYRITVYAGFDTQGKRIRHRMSYRPAPGMSRQIEQAGISASTVGVAVKGESIKIEKAQAIATTMGKRVADVFKVEKNTDPLSDKTILEHHRLISTILTQAKRKCLFPTTPQQRPHRRR